MKKTLHIKFHKDDKVIKLGSSKGLKVEVQDNGEREKHSLDKYHIFVRNKITILDRKAKFDVVAGNITYYLNHNFK